MNNTTRVFVNCQRNWKTKIYSTQLPTKVVRFINLLKSIAQIKLPTQPSIGNIVLMKLIHTPADIPETMYTRKGHRGRILPRYLFSRKMARRILRSIMRGLVTTVLSHTYFPNRLTTLTLALLNCYWK